MLIAGHETTVNPIGNGMYLLLTHPDQRDKVRSDPSLLPGTVEEFLRFESPVQTSTFRLATDPADLAWRPGLLIRGLAQLPVRLSQPSQRWNPLSAGRSSPVRSRRPPPSRPGCR